MSAAELQTGLDSSTTFQIVRSIANVAHFRDATILVSLLQVCAVVLRGTNANDGSACVCETWRCVFLAHLQFAKF